MNFYTNYQWKHTAVMNAGPVLYIVLINYFLTDSERGTWLGAVQNEYVNFEILDKVQYSINYQCIVNYHITRAPI